VTAAEALHLHVPDEPVARADAWRAALREGRDIGDVVSGDDGMVAWLWSRWRAPLAASCVDQDALSRITTGYRRELRLWLEGHRTWAQCCSGLIGRIARRVASGQPTGV